MIAQDTWVEVILGRCSSISITRSMEIAAGIMATPKRSLGEPNHMAAPRRGPTILIGAEKNDARILDLIWSPSPMDLSMRSDDAESEKIQRSMIK